MQEELETMSPLLEEATVETVATMEKIAVDTVGGGMSGKYNS